MNKSNSKRLLAEIFDFIVYLSIFLVLYVLVYFTKFNLVAVIGNILPSFVTNFPITSMLSVSIISVFLVTTLIVIVDSISIIFSGNTIAYKLVGLNGYNKSGELANKTSMIKRSIVKRYFFSLLLSVPYFINLLKLIFGSSKVLLDDTLTGIYMKSNDTSVSTRKSVVVMFILAFVAIIGGILFQGYVSDQTISNFKSLTQSSYPTSYSSASTSSANVQVDSKVYNVGDSVKVGDFTWKVTSVKDLGKTLTPSTASYYSQPKTTTNKWVQVQLTLENTSKEAKTMTLPTISDSNGKTFVLESSVSQYLTADDGTDLGSATYSQIKPSIETKYVGIFEIKNDSKDLSLVVSSPKDLLYSFTQSTPVNANIKLGL